MTSSPYYDHGGITIYHGDCLEILPELGPVGAVVTDPPYGISYQTGMDHRLGTDLSRDRGVVSDGDQTARDDVLAILADTPALVFGSWKAPPPRGTRMTLVWEKGLNCGMGDLSLPWKPNTELVHVIGKGFRGHRGSSVLQVQAPVSQVSWGRLHPTQKPVSLLVQLIGKCPDGIILDPFVGSGTTLRAAKDLGRKAIGIEIEERYCEIAAQRLSQEVLELTG